MINRHCIAILWLSLSPFFLSATALPNQWVEAEVMTSPVYVQAQAVYRVRFYQSVALQHLEVSAPLVRLVEIAPIGELRIFEAERAGNRYRVNEQYYSVSPLASGELHLAGARVTATLPGQDQKTLSWLAPSLTLTVLPVPSAVENSHWLPARRVEMTEQWSVPDGELRQDMIITREVEIKAVGVNAAQIPPLNMDVPGMLVQSQPPQLENSVQGEVTVGTRTQKFLLIPLDARKFIVSPLSLVWWNTQTSATELATLPKRIWRVKAGQANANKKNTPSVDIMKSNHNSYLVAWQIVGMAMVLMLVLLLVVMRTGFYRWWPVLHASHTGDVRQIRDTLLVWVRPLWPESPPLTLVALASVLDDLEAQQLLILMDLELYGRHTTGSRGKSLVLAIYKVRRSVLRVRQNC